MKRTPPVDRIPKPDQKSSHSAVAPRSQPVSLLPVRATQPAVAGKADAYWRLAWPRREPKLPDAPDPGLAVMAAVDLIASDMRSLLPSDAHFRRMLVRYGNLLSEGEGVAAADDLRTLDHYVAEQAFSYARLRRKELRLQRLSITKATAFCVVVSTPGPNIGHPRISAHINFSLTGRGHEARGSVVIEAKP